MMATRLDATASNLEAVVPNLLTLLNSGTFLPRLACGKPHQDPYAKSQVCLTSESARNPKSASCTPVDQFF